MNIAEVKTFIAMISAAYQNYQVSEMTPKIWFSMLQNIDRSKAVAALEKHISSSKWAPTPAEILDIVTADALPQHLKIDVNTAAADYTHPYYTIVRKELISRYGDPRTWLVADNVWRDKYIKERFATLRDEEISKTKECIRNGTLGYDGGQPIAIKGSASPVVNGLLHNLCDTMGERIPDDSELF